MHCPACDHDNIQGAELCRECGLDLAGLDLEWGLKSDDPVLSMPISELAIKEPLLLRPDASVAEAVELMRERREGCVFVTEEQAGLVGMLSERDVIVRVAAPGRDPAKTRLEEVMTGRPATLRPSDPLAWALHRMAVDGYRHLPLLEDGQLVGFLSIRTVIEKLAG